MVLNILWEHAFTFLSRNIFVAVYSFLPIKAHFGDLQIFHSATSVIHSTPKWQFILVYGVVIMSLVYGVVIMW